MPAEIEKLKEEVTKTSDAAAKARVESNLRQAETYLEELKKMKPAPPTRGVPSGVTTLREGGREIQLHVVGRAHTDGDVFVYLPKEKVLVTGDAVVDWMPFIGDGFPEDWVQSLATLEKLDFTHIIPGHGDVAPKAQITFLKNYLADLIAAVKKAAADRATLDEMKSKVADQLAPKYEAGMSKYWTGRYRDRIAVNMSTCTRRSSSRPDDCAPRAGCVPARGRRAATRSITAMNARRISDGSSQQWPPPSPPAAPDLATCDKRRPGPGSPGWSRARPKRRSPPPLAR